MGICFSCNECGRCKQVYKTIIKCPNCQRANRKEASICKKCGAVLKPAKTVK